MTPSPAKQEKALAAVLFDMDGTLLDSEKVWDVALDQLAEWLGGELSARARQRMVGSSLARSIAILHDDLGIDADPETSGGYLTDRTAELFRTELVFKPGADELLDEVRAARIPAALVTSTHRRLTEIALDVLGREHFDASVCGDEVGHPKPHPEPYLTAAARLGVDPRRCVVIEDSPLGIAAAEAAGCVVVAVPSEIVIEPAAALTILDSLTGLSVSRLDELVRSAR